MNSYLDGNTIGRAELVEPPRLPKKGMKRIAAAIADTVEADIDDGKSLGGDGEDHWIDPAERGELQLKIRARHKDIMTIVIQRSCNGKSWSWDTRIRKEAVRRRKRCAMRSYR